MSDMPLPRVGEHDATGDASTPFPITETPTKPRMLADNRFLRKLLISVFVLVALGISSPLWARTPSEDKAIRLEQELDAYLLADEDGDGLSNSQELEHGTNAANPDTDADGLSDAFEIKHHLNPLDLSNATSWQTTHIVTPTGRKTK